MFSAFEEEARTRDESDPLRAFRTRFYLPDNIIYLDGNSLGLLSRDADASLQRVVSEWREMAIGGWMDANPAWFFLPETLGEMVAPLIGANGDEVIVTGSTTLNLHQLLATLFEPAGKRNKILADELNFPSDLFAMESHLRLRGLNPATHLVKVPSRDGFTLDEDDIIAQFTGDIQIAVLPSVLYTSGQLLDIPRLTQEARRRGIVIGWDCSHSIGAIPHHLAENGADFAFWCHYKYLNAGPGAVGGLYLNRRHFGKAPGLAGWFSSRKDRQFDMTHTLHAAENAGALQIGTPHILSLASLEGSLALHAEAGMKRLREKSLALTSFLRRMVEMELTEYGFGFTTPEEDERRGGHLALLHPEASRLGKSLRAAGIVPDFRPPNILRLAPVPLYNSFADCVEAIRRMKRILEARTHEAQPQERGLVP